MSAQMRLEFDWDGKGGVRIGTVDGVLESEAGACGLIVVASAVQCTRESDKLAMENAAAYGVSSFPESSTVSTTGGVFVS